MGQGNRDKPEGLGRGSLSPRCGLLVLAVPGGEGEQGHARGTGMGARGRSGLLGVPGLAGGRPDARSTYPALQRLGFLHWKMSPSAGPPPGRGATAPGLVHPRSTPPVPPGDPATARPEIVNAAPPPVGRSWRQSRPFVPELRQRAPRPLQRVTRGARLRRPPWAGAGGGSGGMAAAGSAGPEPMPSYAQLVQRGWGSARWRRRGGCADCGWGLARRGLAEHARTWRRPSCCCWPSARSAGPCCAQRPPRASFGSVLLGVRTWGPRAGGARAAESWAAACPTVRERWEWGWMRCDRAGEAWDVGTPTREGCSRWGPDPVSEHKEARGGGRGLWLLRTLSDPVEPEIEERRTQGRRFGAQGPSAPCFSGSCGSAQTVLVS